MLVSDRLDKFDWENQITTLHAHAAEIVQDGEDWYLSSCGPEDRRLNNRHGVDLAKMIWMA